MYCSLFVYVNVLTDVNWWDLMVKCHHYYYVVFQYTFGNVGLHNGGLLMFMRAKKGESYYCLGKLGYFQRDCFSPDQSV